MIQPELIHDSQNEELAAEYEAICYQENQLKMYKQQLREELESRVEGDASLIGNVSISKARKPNYAKANIEQARQLGAVYAKVLRVEEVEDAGIAHTVEIDTKAIEGLYKNGANIDMPITEYYICKITTGGDD